MELKARVFRDGTSQENRALRSLDPDYITIDERTAVDWIEFAQTYAAQLTYFNHQNQSEGDWSAFFAGDAEAMADAVASLEGLSSDVQALNAVTASASTPPHLALFLTFLRLLRYPQQQFQALTQRRLDFYYRQVLRLAEKAAIPDRAHVIVSLQPNQSPYVLPQGTPLSAGADAQGNELRYVLDSDLYITQAQVASVKTLSVERVEINLQTIHLAGHRSHDSFAKMLRWAIGTSMQGDELPPFPVTDPLAQAEDSTERETFAAILALFTEIQDYTLEQVTEVRQQYILTQLCFATLDDFQFCFDVHTREIAKQQGQEDVVPPNDAEWQQVYRRVEKAYRKKINRDRRTQLKHEHRHEQYLVPSRDPNSSPTYDAAATFLGLWRFALGDPDAGDALPPWSEETAVDLDKLLSHLDGTGDAAPSDSDQADVAARYVQDQLFLSVNDFRKIMGIQRRDVEEGNSQERNSPEWDSPEWDEVYRLLERAQAKKRGFSYPPINRTDITGICSAAIATTDSDQPLTLPRFHPFLAEAQSSSASGDSADGVSETTADDVQPLGVAIASPVLYLSEGTRAITLTLACTADSFNREALEDVLGQGHRPFAIAISSEKGWLAIPPEQVQFAIGDFFLEPALARYPQTALATIYQFPDADFSASEDLGQYLRFPDGSLYQIDAILTPNRVQLISVGRVDSEEAIAQYDSLRLEGGVRLTRLTLDTEQQELRSTRNQFTEEDVGQFVVWIDGVIYRIEQYANQKRVGIRYWGYLPPSHQTSDNNTPQNEIRKYEQIRFAAPPHAQFSEASLVGMAFSSDFTLEGGGEPQFTASDIGTLMTGVNGDIVQLVGLVSDREASVTPLGRLRQTPTPETTIDHYSATGIYLNSLQFTLTLDVTQPAITAPQTQGDPIPFHTADPVVKITINESGNDGEQGESGETSYYQLFKDFCLEKVNVQVAVTDVQAVQLRSDRTVLNPKSPFEPFGNKPIRGTSFYFSHPELIAKPLDNLSLKLEWMGLPDSFTDHYYAYAHCGLSGQPTVIDNQSFQADLSMLLDRTWYGLGGRSLFTTESNPEHNAEDITLASVGILNYDKAHLITLPRHRLTTIPDSAESTDLWEHPRYFRLELTRPDFQHDRYSLVLNKVARAETGDIVQDQDGNPVQDNQGNPLPIQSLTVYPPYTPKLKSLTLDYCASAEIDLHSETTATDGATMPSLGQIFQLHPFGYVDLRHTATASHSNQGSDHLDSKSDGRYFFLPQYDEEGSLLIGIRDWQPSQPLTLLFQTVSGSGDADLASPEIQWSYLGGDRWHPFAAADVLSDSTDGLLDSGIVRLTLPETATPDNHRLPAGLHWLRATVMNHALAIPDILDIRAQAVTATFVDQNNAPEHLSRPLAAHSIQATVDRIPAIATVDQPYSSFGGRQREPHRAFYTRVSERLRHKHRAVTRWDYERLVLEQFPQIYKVKCLTQSEQARAPNAGQVTVVVIPNIAKTAPFLPLEPKAPQYLLKEIEAYLQAHASPFVRVVVKNPRYEQIKYRVAVRFQSGTEQGYYLKQLNQELVRFLSPWAYEEQSDIAFGSSIHSSAVIHFIESRPYVDYVANLKLIEQVALKPDRRSQSRPTSTVNSTNLAQVKHVDSILVSAPRHIIDLITTDNYEEEAFDGLDYMIVGLDFFIT